MTLIECRFESLLGGGGLLGWGLFRVGALNAYWGLVRVIQGLFLQTKKEHGY